MCGLQEYVNDSAKQSAGTYQLLTTVKVTPEVSSSTFGALGQLCHYVLNVLEGVEIQSLNTSEHPVSLLNHPCATLTHFPQLITRKRHFIHDR